MAEEAKEEAHLHGCVEWTDAPRQTNLVSHFKAKKAPCRSRCHRSEKRIDGGILLAVCLLFQSQLVNFFLLWVDALTLSYLGFFCLFLFYCSNSTYKHRVTHMCALLNKYKERNHKINLDHSQHVYDFGIILYDYLCMFSSLPPHHLTNL